jgi:peroxiredoxin
MAKININDYFPNFQVDTIYERNKKLSDVVGSQKTAIMFLRYAGCTLCRFDMMSFKDEYQKISDTDTQLVVVLQSDPDKLSKNISKGFYPYIVICDPSQIMYQQLEIKPANVQEEMVGPGTMDKIKLVEASGFTHGDYEGEEMQLPALFIMDSSLKVIHAHYASYVTDLPNVDELVELLAEK